RSNRRLRKTDSGTSLAARHDRQNRSRAITRICRHFCSGRSAPESDIEGNRAETVYRSFTSLNYLGTHNFSYCGRRGVPAMGTYFVVKALDEHERTMAFAEVALGQIRSLRQTAVPRNYEIWYVYATGYNPSLNKIINETLARNGKLTESDLEQIYETY